MKTYFATLLCLGLIFGIFACSSQPNATEQATETNDAQLNDDMNEDLEEAAEAFNKAFGLNSKILTVSQMAADQASLSPELQTLVQQIQTDHQQVEQQLKDLAGKHNIELSTAMNYDDNSDVGQLRAAAPEEFTEEFVELLDDASEDLAAALVDLEDEGGDVDAEVATFVQQVLPTIEAHEEQIDQLEDSM